MIAASRSLSAVFVLIAALFTSPSVWSQSTPEPLSAFPRSLLSIRTATGKILSFQIWTADRPARQEQGLMFVRDMDEHAGMLFVFPTDQRLSMWMKNTYLPLDMVFTDDSGRIRAIVPQAVPLSLDIISPPQIARAVLELKGGITEKFGIRVGDVLLSPIFHNVN